MTIVVVDQGVGNVGLGQPQTVNVGSISSLSALITFAIGGYTLAANNDISGTTVDWSDGTNDEAMTVVTIADNDVWGVAAYLLNPQTDGDEFTWDIVVSGNMEESTDFHWATFRSNTGATIGFLGSGTDTNNSGAGGTVTASPGGSPGSGDFLWGMASGYSGGSMNTNSQTEGSGNDYSGAANGYRVSGMAWGDAGTLGGDVVATGVDYAAIVALAFDETGGGGGGGPPSQLSLMGAG